MRRRVVMTKNGEIDRNLNNQAKRSFTMLYVYSIRLTHNGEVVNLSACAKSLSEILNRINLSYPNSSGRIIQKLDPVK